MTKEKTRDDELTAFSKQIMPHPYSAMDYSFDHLKKPSHQKHLHQSNKNCPDVCAAKR